MRLDEVALFRQLPRLIGRVPWARLGDWPTPVEPLRGLSDALGAEVWTKREDRSSSIYGGNKVRTLEAMFGRALDAGARVMWATGAYGSNHAVATVLHAPTVGLGAGAILFPQPPSGPARDNLSAMLGAAPAIVQLDSIALLPLAMWKVRRDRHAYVMPPGGATPQGALGALGAALELAEQVARGDCPAPVRIVVPAGSTCTSAGLLAGLHLAGQLRLGFTPQTVPMLTVTRVTPWPITSPARIALFALRTLQALDRALPAGGSSRPAAAADHALLRAHLEVDGAQLRAGYGRITARGERARLQFERHGGPPLDIVYAAKAGAAVIELAPQTRGPVLFWATKSSAPLPLARPADLMRAAPALRAWLGERDR